MLHYIQYTTKSLYKGCVDPIFVEWISGSNLFGNVSYEMQTQNVLDIYSYKRLLQNNILHISYLKLTPQFKIWVFVFYPFEMPGFEIAPFGTSPFFLNMLLNMCKSRCALNNCHEFIFHSSQLIYHTNLF